MSDRPIELRNLTIEQLINLKKEESLKVSRIRSINDAKEEALKDTESAQKFMKSLVSGNSDSINNILWPYFFVLGGYVESGSILDDTFQVSTEAEFIWTKCVSTIFEVEEDSENEGEYLTTLIKPDNYDVTNKAPNLVFDMQDYSSERSFMDKPIPVEIYGNPKFPYRPIKPQMMRSTQVMNYSIRNDSSKNYFVYIMIHGYRLRLQNADEIFSLVTE